jgi:hypothetical protein
LYKLSTSVVKKINTREYRRGNKKGQSRETGNIWYTRHIQINVREYRRGIEKRQSREKLATYGTQDTGQINVREYRRGNEKGQFRETGNQG